MNVRGFVMGLQSCFTVILTSSHETNTHEKASSSCCDIRMQPNFSLYKSKLLEPHPHPFAVKHTFSEQIKNADHVHFFP